MYVEGNQQAKCVMEKCRKGLTGACGKYKIVNKNCNWGMS